MSEVEQRGPLLRYIEMATSIKIIKGDQANILEEANAEYAKLAKENEKVVVDGTKIFPNKPPIKWSWPGDVIQLEIELKAKKDVAKIDGTANDITEPYDPQKNQLFRVG